MKISGVEKVIFAVTAAFLLFAGGFFLVGDRDESYTVDVQTVRSSEVDDAIPARSGPRVVNINTATAEQLQSLPGIGAVRARNIVADREANGPFRFPEDLIRVSGIGEGTLHEILDYITVE